MAEVVELFQCLDKEGGEEEEAENGEEEEDESRYWSSALIPILPDPVFSSACRSSFSDSEESAIAAADCSDYNTPFARDLSDDTPPSPLFDPDPEALDSRDFTVHDFLDGGELGAVGNRLFVSSPESHGGDLRIVGFGSESDSSKHDGVIEAADCDNGSIAPNQAPDDLGRQLSSSFIPTDDGRRNSIEEFEWEEVDDRLDDRGVLGMMVGNENDVTSSRRGEVVDVHLEPEEASGDVEEDDFIDTDSNFVSELMLFMNNHVNTSLIDALLPENDRMVFIDLADPSDYEFQFGLLDHDNIIRGSPPAAKLLVDALPSIMLTEEDFANNKYLCAICKDEFSLEERANQLPCSHLYHIDCILPWLGIRNTCPVCRYELPTDDPDYESLKGRI
ncbi:uncharacterized protein LOC110101353 [Dendrobium catenatum]|uniref:RING-type E3 ubiquitin transferase n=1 Tax=Dendrobium catenatum TaxID=906689 RepID=A0A2I0VP98_9ASPA|nr:uncharacterized protein LOC110101353 [Dendrobium catenatum]PKU65230.1 E3 ubiquitin-protein ligase RING1 [Dendrobium catenatum]